MESDILSILEKTNLLTDDWFYGLCAVLWGFFIFIKDQREKTATEKDAAQLKNIENNYRMKSEFRLSWEKFIALPEDSKKIFLMDYEAIDDENTRVNIFSIISILHDVHVFHQMRKTTVSENLIWTGTFEHVFDEEKHKAFVNAFRKFTKDNQFSPEFVKCVEEIIKTNKHSAINFKEKKVS